MGSADEQHRVMTHLPDADRARLVAGLIAGGMKFREIADLTNHSLRFIRLVWSWDITRAAYEELLARGSTR